MEFPASSPSLRRSLPTIVRLGPGPHVAVAFIAPGPLQQMIVCQLVTPASQTQNPLAGTVWDHRIYYRLAGARSRARHTTPAMSACRERRQLGVHSSGQTSRLDASALGLCGTGYPVPRRKGPMDGLWVKALWQPCILYSASLNVNLKVLDFVQFGGVSTDRACLRRVAAPIMSTWAVPTPWQRVARRNHRRRVRASSRRE